MFGKLISLFTGSKMLLITDAINKLTPVLEHLETNYKNDGNAKAALIDTLCDILQQHKPMTVTPQVTADSIPLKNLMT